jgi:hypothetical protein
VSSVAAAGFGRGSTGGESKSGSESCCSEDYIGRVTYQ